MLNKKKYDALQTKYAGFVQLNHKAGFPVLDDMCFAIVDVNSEENYQRLDKELDHVIQYAQDSMDGTHEREYQKQLAYEKANPKPKPKESGIKIRKANFKNPTSMHGMPSREIMNKYHARLKAERLAKEEAKRVDAEKTRKRKEYLASLTPEQRQDIIEQVLWQFKK